MEGVGTVQPTRGVSQGWLVLPGETMPSSASQRSYGRRITDEASPPDIDPPKTSWWRDRDLALLVGGSTVNGVGDWLLELALPLYVFVETGSGLATAAVYLIGLVIGLVLGPIGGALADRWPVRRTLVGTNVAQIVALLPLLFVEPDRIWPVYVVVVAQGAVSSVNDPATFVLLPRLVSGERLVGANSALSVGESLARLAGAAAGGAAVAVGGLELVVIADGATFVVGAATAAFLSDRANSREDENDDGDDAPGDASVRAGIRVIRERREIAALVWIQGLAMFGFGMFPVLFIVFVTETLGGDEAAVGLIRASAAFGGLLAAAVIGGLAARVRPAQLMMRGYLLFAAVAFAFVNAPELTTAIGVYVVLFALSGFPNVATQVGMRSSAQVLCPPAVLGRLGGLMTAATSVGMGAGSILAGAAVGAVGARPLFNGQVAVLLTCGFVAWWFVVRPTRPTGSAATDDRVPSPG